MLEELLAAHGCEVDYDGVCVGCVCGPTYLQMRDGKAPEQDHAGHAHHLAQLISSDR